MNFRNVFGKKEIKRILNLLVDYSRKNPNTINDLCCEIEKDIKKYGSFQTGNIVTKNDFIALVGVIHGDHNSYISFAKKLKPGISLQFFNEIKQIKNGSIEELLESPKCIGIIFGGVFHSVRGNPEEKLKDKSVGASLPNGKRKLTISTFKTSLPLLLQKINY